MTMEIDDIVIDLKKSIQLLQNAPRRILMVQGGTYPTSTDVAWRLASELKARYVDHLTELLPSLSDFPLEAYKPSHLRNDLHRIMDKEKRTVVIANLEPLLCIWNEADQQRFLISLASFTHNNILILFCGLPLQYGSELSNQLRVYQVS
jgi:hypothetical protein